MGSGATGRALGFADGFLLDSDAFLVYQLPLDSLGCEFDGGTIEFSVYEAMATPRSRRLALAVSADGGTWMSLAEVLQPGQYQFDLTGTFGPSDRLYVRFVGSGVALDNLSITLLGPVVVVPTTWSFIKSSFR